MDLAKPRLVSPPSPKAKQVSKPIPMNPNSPVRNNIGHNSNDSYITRTGRAVSRPKSLLIMYWTRNSHYNFYENKVT